MSKDKRFIPVLIGGDWYVHDKKTGVSYWDFFSCEQDAIGESDALNNTKHFDYVHKLRGTSDIAEIDKLLCEVVEPLHKRIAELEAELLYLENDEVLVS